MLSYADFDPGTKTFVFELDDVLYPQRDYLLQVYYLFANFLEYTETVPPANDLTELMKAAYEAHGPTGLFEKAAETFGIDSKYKENFDRLHVSAQLPLKLLLYPEIQDLLQAIKADAKHIFILTKGNPLVQLNKLKHIDWQGLENDLKVYFYDELKLKTELEPLLYLTKENDLLVKDILMIGGGDEDRENAKKADVNYFDISLLL